MGWINRDASLSPSHKQPRPEESPHYRAGTAVGTGRCMAGHTEARAEPRAKRAPWLPSRGQTRKRHATAEAAFQTVFISSAWETEGQEVQTSRCSGWKVYIFMNASVVIPCILLRRHVSKYQPGRNEVFSNICAFEQCLTAQLELVLMDLPMFAAKCFLSGFNPEQETKLSDQRSCWSPPCALVNVSAGTNIHIQACTTGTNCWPHIHIVYIHTVQGAFIKVSLLESQMMLEHWTSFSI